METLLHLFIILLNKNYNTSCNTTYEWAQQQLQLYWIKL